MASPQSPGVSGTHTAPPGGTSAKPAPDARELRRDVEEIADVAVERGRGFVAAARSHAVGYADQRKGEAARTVSDLAGTLRESGQNLGERPNIKAFFDSAAEGLDDLAGSIERRSVDDLYAEAEAFARRSPVAVAVATFAAGLAFARFVKASGDRGPTRPGRV